MRRNVLIRMLLGPFGSMRARGSPGLGSLPPAPSAKRRRDLELKPNSDYRGVSLRIQWTDARKFTMRRTTARAIAFLAGIILCCVASADDFVSAQSLRQTISHLPADFSPLQIVEITSDEPTSTIQTGYWNPVRFFQHGSVYWSSIPVYKRHQPIEVAVVSTPDCSAETFALRSNGNGLVELLVIKRFPFKTGPLPPQNTPLPRTIDVFQLTRNSEGTPGYPPLYFKWTHSKLIQRPVCTASDVEAELAATHAPPR